MKSDELVTNKDMNRMNTLFLKTDWFDYIHSFIQLINLPSMIYFFTALEISTDEGSLNVDDRYTSAKSRVSIEFTDDFCGHIKLCREWPKIS